MLFWWHNVIVASSRLAMARLHASPPLLTPEWSTVGKRSSPLASFLYASRYHLGSIALGSMWIATFGWLRSSDTSDKKAPAKKVHGKCSLLRQSLSQLASRKAYVMMAIQGHDFRQSSQSALAILRRNSRKYADVDKICDFILFTAKMWNVMIIGIIAFFWDGGIITSYEASFNHTPAPLLIIIMMQYLTVSALMHIIETGVDTALIVLMYELETDNELEEKRDHSNSKLINILKRIRSEHRQHAFVKKDFSHDDSNDKGELEPDDIEAVLARRGQITPSYEPPIETKTFID